MRSFFEKQISSLIQKMILPGLKTDQDDMDLWTDDPLNFISCFLQNRDNNEKRQVCIDLQKQLS